MNQYFSFILFIVMGLKQDQHVFDAGRSESNFVLMPSGSTLTVPKHKGMR